MTKDEDKNRRRRYLPGFYLVLICTQLVFGASAHAQQIAIPRIEAMPNKPSPYVMRDWKRVALGYDSLVFSLSDTGQYLPLAWINSSTVNYPGQSSFGLHTVVGTTDPTSAEAINCLPAVIGATLVGIDKTNQNGYNWVRMCQEWFNNRAAENVYLNHPVASSGSDWWYETMPNVFFYELASMFPDTADFHRQFTIVADRWLAALMAMGASTTPWSLANVDHRAWYLSTMTPNNTSVHEPEAAGAIAWLLYNAYVRTGNQQYRIGAELAMESLLVYTTDPSYELQLPYGTYIAARMNAELGTTYDVGKMVNWCFNVGPLRSWGSTVGTWGAYDCSGLIGEINGSNDYAFLMNTFEQAGALVPLVRYDDRFARTIGKWMLNAANAARLFYTNALPQQNQDSYSWSVQYDSSSVIAHEALHQFNPSNGTISPYATGDAISDGWGLTNLSLYGSSHVGIFGGIIDTTNVPMILRLDVRKTDYFQTKAFPTYLYFNPDSIPHDVAIDLGAGQHDLYDEVSNSFLISGQTGSVMFTVPSNSAVLAVITPSGGAVTYDLDRMLVNDTVVDYHSGRVIANYPPRIKALAADTTTVATGKSTTLFCTATDPDGDTLTYLWSAQLGSIGGSGRLVTWTAPDSVGTFWIICTVGDGHGAQAADTLHVQVVQYVNQVPSILGMSATPRKINLGASSSIACTASDPDGDTLTFSWSARAGSISGSGSAITWLAPASAGNYYVSCLVDDGHGGQALDSIGLEVRDFSIAQSGILVAWYPFSGNANDASGNNRNGIVSGATLTADRFGNPNSAYAFNGSTSLIRITNDSGLNFQNAITVACWMKVSAFYAREQYPISHGNWQNRWKISITPGTNTLRWTVKTNVATKDLDSETHLQKDSLYYVTALYSGSDYEIWLNGRLDAFSSLSGSIQTTTIDPAIGQDLPTDNNYNFNGVLDEIRIYDYALSVSQIDSLYALSTGVDGNRAMSIPQYVALGQNFPNPFNPSTTISYQLPADQWVSVRVFDMLGREVATLVNGRQHAGYKRVEWNAAGFPSGLYFCVMTASDFRDVKKLLLVR